MLRAVHEAPQNSPTINIISAMNHSQHTHGTQRTAKKRAAIISVVEPALLVHVVARWCTQQHPEQPMEAALHNTNNESEQCTRTLELVHKHAHTSAVDSARDFGAFDQAKS